MSRQNHSNFKTVNHVAHSEHRSSIKSGLYPETESLLHESVETVHDTPATRNVYIDAGVEHIRFRAYDRFSSGSNEILTHNLQIKNNDDIRRLFKQAGIHEFVSQQALLSTRELPSVFITGKLSEIAQKVLPESRTLIPEAALWSAAKFLISSDCRPDITTLGIVDLSASGYMVICVDKQGDLIDDLLIANPRCGAGTGVNLSRILEKLDIDRKEVDLLLSEFIGASGKEKREKVLVRSDRCGVFSSSATVSDKNQGIPLAYALAVTMKSEVLKPCHKIPAGVDKVYLTGGVFRWEFARNCAEDYLYKNGVREIVFDQQQSVMFAGMRYLIQTVGEKNLRKKEDTRLRKPNRFLELPSFQSLKMSYESRQIYTRLENPKMTSVPAREFENMPVNIGLDIGSTMAKIVVTHAQTGDLLVQRSYENHGDTIETIKHIFREFKSSHVHQLNIQNIGITGSGRYQVQKTLKAIYPHLSDRISVLVENYAHARGSVLYAESHIARLKSLGHTVNEDFYLLIDIGGEDTKISVISLQKKELFDNAMNIKCSAGTGSLMDTLKALFNIDEIGEAYTSAMNAAKAYGINATCAVFLMENARKMQAEGYTKDIILASCCHAIVENMARSLWNQVEIPPNTIVLLHGQTMLSDPLPLAVTHRAQEFGDTETFCLVPPFPGHRACFGLIQSMENLNLPRIRTHCHLDDFIDRQFEKKIIICRGAACGDKNSRCARTRLTSVEDQNKISLVLGGCTAVNEMQARQNRHEQIDVPESYKEIWNFINNRLPKSEDENRVIVPRSFAVSEKAIFFASIFEQMGLPVHVDNVREEDIIAGQPLFSIDTCAPNLGATGQFLRLAREPHGVILVPQIDFLKTESESLGRTCTTNQGGILIAKHFAEMRYPDARFELFDISLKTTEPRVIADQLYSEFKSIFEYYNLNITFSRFVEIIDNAEKAYQQLRMDTMDVAAGFIQEAIKKKLNISIILAREYIMTPGIYDSHIGKLLKDRSVVAIPAYIFDIHPDKQFDGIYWRNPNDLMIKANAIANNQFHHILKDSRLRELVQQIETQSTDSLMSVVTVSTFRCGPDSVTLPILSEVTKNMPSLLIQSDAMIAELAHLENRVNTHLNQLNKRLHKELNGNDDKHFSAELFNEFSLDSLNPKTDVVYFPTMGDNRPVTAVFRAAGLCVIDNYDDMTFDLEEKAKKGRKHVGDSVCTPLAVVFSDFLDATQDFMRRKQANDPLTRGKNRIVLFMYKGDGPCRQGQYVDICKFNIQKIFSTVNTYVQDETRSSFPVKFMEHLPTSLHSNTDYIAVVDKWTTIQGIHALGVMALFHAIHFTGSANCKDVKAYRQFRKEFLELKTTLLHTLEKNVKPHPWMNACIDFLEDRVPKLSGIVKYFGYGFYNNNGLRKILKPFGDKWLQPPAHTHASHHQKIRVHVEGEIYMRVSQVDEILKLLIDTLGFGNFELSYTPVWSFFEYILESRILISNKQIEMYTEKMDHTESRKEKKKYSGLILEEQNKIKEASRSVHHLRNIMVGPLYKAAGLDVPHRMDGAIRAAKEILPKYKPFGELVPYVGETIARINDGVDLVLNVAPEGCMVASMGEILTPKILQHVENSKAKIQYLSTTDGEINEEVLRLALCKVMGPERYYA